MRRLKAIIDKFGGIRPLLGGILKLYSIRLFFFIVAKFRFRRRIKGEPGIHNFKDFVVIDDVEEVGSIAASLYDANDPIGGWDVKETWEPYRYMSLSARALQGLSCSSDMLPDFPHDTNAMEVSIGLINLLVAGESAHDLSNKKFYSYVEESVKYILMNVEKGLVFSNNHYFFNCLGLLWYSYSTDSKFIVRVVALKELLSYFRASVLADGGLMEGSTYYHKYVLESLLLFLFRWENKLDSHSGVELREIAGKMLFFLYKVRNKNNLLIFGDADSGRLLPLPTLDNYNSRSLALIDLLAARMGILIESNEVSRSEFGIYRLEESSTSVVVRLFSDTERSKGLITSHFHCDQNSFILCVHGHEIITSLGTYSYSLHDELRMKMRLSDRYSTVMVDGIPQHNIANDWRDRDITSADFLYLDKNNFIGKSKDILCQEFVRRIKVSKNIVEVIDEIGESKFGRGFLHFHPSVMVTRIASDAFCLKIDMINIKISSDSHLSVMDTQYSNNYGRRENTKSLYYDFVNRNKLVIDISDDTER